jgi:glucan 1,3-beta-glucosidase
MGDGVTDDTANINATIENYGLNYLIFFPAGTYIVTNTIFIPAGTNIVGEAWSVIGAIGSAFSDPSNLLPMIQVGAASDNDTAHISDMLFTVSELLPGLSYYGS